MKDVLRVLVVEDDPSFAELLKRNLEESAYHKFSVDVVETMGEAFVAIRFSSYDAIVADLNLANSKGVETVKSLCEFAPAIPVVVLTGIKDKEIHEATIRAGADECQSKDHLNGGFPLSIVSTYLRNSRPTTDKVATRLLQCLESYAL